MERCVYGCQGNPRKNWLLRVQSKTGNLGFIRPVFKKKNILMISTVSMIIITVFLVSILYFDLQRRLCR